MVSKQSVSLRHLSEGRHEEVRFGRFLAHHKVTPSALIAGWSEGVAASAAGRHVLAIQDTTELHFSTRPGRRRGLGRSGKGNVYGLQVHPVLAVDAADGVCHGLAGGAIWSRPASGVARDKHLNRFLPLSEKETWRFQTSAEAAGEVLSSARHVTMVADAEADIYALFARLPGPGRDVLIRSARDRRLGDGGKLYARSDSWPVAGERVVEVRERAGRRARTMRLELRFEAIAIARPQPRAEPDLPASVRLWLVDVRELDAPAGETALHWRLLTSHRLDDAAAAWRIVDWYAQRWHIEQLFRTMKSKGLQIEASQLSEAERLIKLAAVATRAACLIMQLVQARDGGNEQKAAHAFEPDEVEVLHALAPRMDGSTMKQKNPHPPDSLAWAAWIIARLGGWSGYASYRPPGPITMLNGLKRFKAIAEGVTLHDM